MKKAVLIVSALAVAGALFVLYWVRQEPIKTEIKQVPDLVFSGSEGKEVRLRDFVRKPMVISSWATWCSQCRDSMSDLRKLQEEFGEKIVVILVNRGENIKVEAGSLQVLDPKDSFYKSIGGYQMPETTFVDKEGFIVMHKRGLMNFEELRRRAEEILQ